MPWRNWTNVTLPNLSAELGHLQVFIISFREYQIYDAGCNREEFISSVQYSNNIVIKYLHEQSNTENEAHIPWQSKWFPVLYRPFLRFVRLICHSFEWCLPLARTISILTLHLVLFIIYLLLSDFTPFADIYILHTEHRRSN